jgi:hypothetical protein
MDAVITLLAQGADPTLTSYDGTTALEAAEQQQHVEIVAVLQTMEKTGCWGLGACSKRLLYAITVRWKSTSVQRSSSGSYLITINITPKNTHHACYHQPCMLASTTHPVTLTGCTLNRRAGGELKQQPETSPMADSTSGWTFVVLDGTWNEARCVSDCC